MSGSERKGGNLAEMRNRERDSIRTAVSSGQHSNAWFGDFKYGARLFKILPGTTASFLGTLA